MAQTGQFVPLAEQLIAQHYDPRYGKKAASRAQPMGQVRLPNMQPSSLQAAALQIVSIAGK
jgi:tRNA 2-selenouridine synthase